jgi:hypothetical protein
MPEKSSFFDFGRVIMAIIGGFFALAVNHIRLMVKRSEDLSIQESKNLRSEIKDIKSDQEKMWKELKEYQLISVCKANHKNGGK